MGESVGADRNLWKRVILRCIILLFTGWFLIYAAPRLIHLLLPFIIALLVARLLHPLVEGARRKLKIPGKVTAAIFDVLIFTILFSLLGLLASYLFEQVAELAASIQRNWGQISTGFQQGKAQFNWLLESLPADMTALLGGLQTSVIAALQSGGKAVLNALLSGMTAFTAHTGNFFVNLLMAVMAAYYMAADYNGLVSRMKAFLGAGVCRYLSVIGRSVSAVLGAYVKSMGLMAAFAFLFMLAALLLCRQPYALLIALLLSLIDFLPLVGTIAVLIPWGALEMISGDMNKGIYLIIVGIVFYLVRQIVSPKIVGTQTGLSPLAALVSMYVGLKVSGVFGAIFGPMAVMLVLSILKSGIFDSTAADFKQASKRVVSILAKTDA